MNQTLAIIKPDIIERKLEGDILKRIVDAGFEIVELKTLQLSKEQAIDFYKEHEGKSFFDKLINFMVRNKILVLHLRKNNAVSEWRKTIGGVDLLKREKNTIRGKYALSLTENSVHGSDSETSAKRELSFFGFQID